METFNFNLFLNLVLPLQEGYMPGGTDVTQEPELLLSSLSLLGYAIPLEGSVMVFFLLLGVYILGRNIRLSPQEKVHAAISMGALGSSTIDTDKEHTGGNCYWWCSRGNLPDVRIGSGICRMCHRLQSEHNRA